MNLTVDPKHVLFDIVLPFIRARYDRRMLAHHESVARMRNGQCPECMRKYMALWKDKRRWNALWRNHFDERHDPVWRRALELDPIRPWFRLTCFGRHMLSTLWPPFPKHILDYLDLEWWPGICLSWAGLPCYHTSHKFLSTCEFCVPADDDTKLAAHTLLATFKRRT